MSKVESIKSRKKRKDELDRTIEQIHTFYERYCKELNFDPNDRIQNLSNEKERETGKKYFTSRTDSLRREISTYIKLGHTEEEALTRVLPKAYGLVRAASAFLWNKPHYDVQLKGGILLNQGYASEMATGEGKTLTATLPTYLNALLGKGAHVITPNGYLAKRDCEEMSELYELLGLSCRLAEERISISQEAIMDKTIGILAPEIGLHTLYARNEEERQTLTQKFLSDKKNKTIVEKARAKAIEALRKEETLRRRKAYEADITYGSSATFAFDYLRDDIENDPNKTVQRKGTPNFAVIDEVDAVLFDDATTPFTLSGEQTDIELAITDEEKNDKTRNANKANLAIARINNESKKIIERNGDKFQALISYVVNDDDKFEAILNNETESANFQDMTRAIIINDNTQEYKLTTLGEIMVFQFYCDKDINKILKENLSKIVEMKFDNGPLYREGLDYVINEYGRIEIEPRAFAHLVISETIPDLSKRFHQFYSNELIRYRNEIDNAIKAWYILKEDVEYVLTVPKDAKDPNERSVSLVMNGRTAEGRVYSNGLQQAIENKIKYQKQIPIRETKIKSTLASIPTASFFARYSKFGGMTGTSADNAFRNLYGLETREVERNKPRQVIDHGERLYPNPEEKYEAIFQEVLKSYKKGQPVLLSTTSIEESERMNIYLTNRLQQYDGQFKIGTIKVLNANVNQLEEEAAIVSKAGLPKMITIATEMAGRGTDIKLGGEVPDIEELVSIVENELVSKSIINLKKIQPITQQNESYIQNQIRKKISSDRKTLLAIAQQRQEILKEHRSELKRKVEEAGGLKVIGCGHFPYSRVDQQVKGRCGRQGDPGEVIFFNDPSDLLKVGVPKEKVEFLAEQAKLSPIIEDPKTKRTPISDVVYAAQRKTETLTEMAIKNNQEVESQVARFRRNLRTQKEMIQQQGDYIDTMEYLIEEFDKNNIEIYGGRYGRKVI